MKPRSRKRVDRSSLTELEHCEERALNLGMAMANGKWPMANGKWRMANGEWRMANDEAYVDIDGDGDGDDQDKGENEGNDDGGGQIPVQNPAGL